MKREWKLVAGVCGAIACGIGIGFITIFASRDSASLKEEDSSVVTIIPEKGEKKTPWKDTLEDALSAAVFLRQGSDTLPERVKKLTNPLADLGINFVSLGTLLADFIEKNRIDEIMQALTCLIQTDEYLLQANKEYIDSGKKESPSGCPEIFCVNKRVCIAVNLKLFLDLFKQYAEIVFGKVAKNAQGKNVIQIGVIPSLTELLHNGAEVALESDETLKIFPAQAKKLMEKLIIDPSAKAFKMELRLARTFDKALTYAADALPKAIGGPEYRKLIGAPTAAAESKQYLERVDVSDEITDFTLSDSERVEEE